MSEKINEINESGKNNSLGTISGLIFVVLIIIGLIYSMTPKSTPDLKKEVVNTELDKSLETNKEIKNNKNMMHKITLETNKGKIVFETYDADAPNTVKNFITLAQKGFYNGLTFHRVIKDFMIQGGDPIGNGTGGPGYKFDDELNPNTESAKIGYKRGVVAMANAGPNTNGSQFFIMHKDVPLPYNYTIFGNVVSGLETVDAIADSKTDSRDMPLSKIQITKVTVEEVK